MVTETTRNPITMLVFEFSLRLSSVTSIETVEPAGIIAPFVPLTASESVELKRSPTLCVLVQTFVAAARFSVVPAATVPILGAGGGAGVGVGAGAGAVTGG